MKMVFSVCLLLCLILTPPAIAAQQPFQQGSLSAIETRYAEQPFLLVLWSIECPPCRHELALLGHLRQAGTAFNLVLVATDTITQQQTLNEILTEHQLTQSDSWAFAEGSIEKLRYQIDPDWYGEMPRSYFYDAAHQRIGVSGKLNEQRIRQWLAGQP